MASVKAYRKLSLNQSYEATNWHKNTYPSQNLRFISGDAMFSYLEPFGVLQQPRNKNVENLFLRDKPRFLE